MHRVRRQDKRVGVGGYLREGLGHFGSKLSRLTLMVQAAVLDGECFDVLSPFDDCGVSPEVGIGGGDVADTLMVAVVIVATDEGADLAFQITRQEIVLQQDAVLQRLMPALGLALGLGGDRVRRESLNRAIAPSRLRKA